MARRYRVSQRHLDDLEDRVVNTTAKKVAQAGARGARRRVHVLSGKLKGSIGWRVENGRAVYGAGVNYPVPYADDEEFGNRERPGHAYLRPSIDDAREAARRG